MSLVQTPAKRRLTNLDATLKLILKILHDKDYTFTISTIITLYLPNQSHMAARYHSDRGYLHRNQEILDQQIVTRLIQGRTPKRLSCGGGGEGGQTENL